jgi:hypothetical protein
VNRQRILEVVNNLTEDELEKISEMLKQTEEPNNENGELPPEVTLSKEAAEETKDTRGPEDERDAVSKASKTTKNTMISSLVSQLDEERQARQRLEQELSNLKKISLEIQDQLRT